MKNQKIYNQITDFIYETGIHARTPRSGFWFLGSGDQSVAEHLFHTTLIAYALCYLEPEADKSKVVLMAMFHDLAEGRTSDHNYVHQRYGRLSEVKAMKDISDSVPFGKEIFKLYKEEQEHKSLEAKIVKDADQLEWISTLRIEEEKGNKKAKEWIEIAMKRLKTESGKKLGRILMEKHPDSWWFDIHDKWLIDRKEEYREWRKGK